MEQVKNHNGYIVPFDIPSESLKKGDILRHKNGLDDDMFENIVILNSSYCLPPEWVETWEKYSPETNVATAPDYSKLIELIEGEIEKNKKQENESKFFESSLYNIRRNALEDILTKIKAL